MSGIRWLFAAALALVLVTGPGRADDRILDLATGEEITRDALVARLVEAEIAILGEIHDNPVHHERQAWLVERLRPAGLAFEMVPRTSEDGIRALIEEGAPPSAIGPAIGWEKLGWPDWEIYAPIFEAAPKARITGGGLPRDSLMAAMRDGAAAAFGTDAARWGLDTEPEPALRREMAEEMVAAHCDRLPFDVGIKMIDAQRLRDASFADAALRALAEGPRAVLITGNGHARTDRGVPAYLAHAEPELTVLSLGQIELAEGEALPAGLPYDYVWTSAPHPRPDPCEAFKGVGE